MDTHDGHRFWSNEEASDDQCKSGNPHMDMIIALCAPFALRFLINSILAKWENVNRSWQNSRGVVLDSVSIHSNRVSVDLQHKYLAAVDIIRLLKNCFQPKPHQVQILSAPEAAKCTNGPQVSDTPFELEQVTAEHNQVNNAIQDCTSWLTRPDYDLVIIGGGVVGVQAALAAASFSKKACLIDSSQESGVFTNGKEDLSLGAPTGLFSKVLRDTSKHTKVSWLRGMGLRDDSIWKEIVSSCHDLAWANANDVVQQLKDAGVDHLNGLASFSQDGKSLVVSKQEDLSVIETISAAKILIATGSRAHQPKGVPLDGKRIFDSDSINHLGYLPKSIAISGGGIIAVEYANIFRNLGAEVTLIIRDQVPCNALIKIGLDREIAETLVADMVRKGIQIETGAQVGHFDVPSNNEQDPITIQLQAKGGGPRPPGESTELKVHAYLAAVGRKSNTEKLNLGAAGIKVDKHGGILVDSSMRTSCKSGNVYAAGDVVGRPFVASVGKAQGLLAVKAMFGSTSQSVGEESTPRSSSLDPKSSTRADPFAIAYGIWSDPEAAYYGLNVQQAKESGIDCDEGVANYAECLRGRVFSPNGMLKLVFCKPTGQILGVHIYGDHACELIHYGMEIVTAKRTLMDLSNRLYAAVTFHELYRLAAENGLTSAKREPMTAETTLFEPIPKVAKEDEWEILSA